MVNHWFREAVDMTACNEYGGELAYSISTDTTQSVSCPDCVSWLELNDVGPTRLTDGRLEKSDAVNHPAHYKWLPGNVEVIDITEHMSFPLGNVVKYVLRADHKGKPLEDLRKAAWYLDREIARRESSG